MMIMMMSCFPPHLLIIDGGYFDHVQLILIIMRMFCIPHYHSKLTVINITITIMIMMILRVITMNLLTSIINDDHDDSDDDR